MRHFTSVGDFIDIGTTHLEFAVYGSIAMDRLLHNFQDKQDGWANMRVLEQMLECWQMIYLPHESTVKRTAAQKAAHASHARHREFKAKVIAYYTEHQKKYKSMDAAAEAIVSKVKLVPVAFRTVRDWIAEHRKRLRSARKA